MAVATGQIIETAEIAATYFRVLVNNGMPTTEATMLTASYVSTLVIESIRMGQQKPRDPWETG